MKNTKTLAAALILTTIVGGTAATIAKAQSPNPAKWISAWESREKADSPKEIADEKAEAAKLVPMAKISQSQAKNIALQAYTGNGQIKEVQLEDEDGTIVYGVEFVESDSNEVDVKVDAKTGKIFKIEDDRNETEDASENDSDTESGEENEAPETAESEAAETARLAPMAKIPASQAETTALATHPGTVDNVVLEDEDGQIVYGVEYANGDEVKVDAKTGKVVKVEQGGEDNDNVHGHREEEEKDEDDDGNNQK